MRSVLALAAVFMLGACQQPDHITIDPKEPVLRSSSDRLQLVSHIMSGTYEYVREQVAWSTEDADIAIIEGNGKLRGISGGRTRAIATYKGLTASVPVEVAFVDKLVTDMTEVTLSYDAGDPIRPRLDALGYDGRKLKDRTVFLEPENQKICRVDSSGQIWPVNKGETIVRAKLEEQVVEIKCSVK